MRKLPVKPVSPPAYLQKAKEGNVPWDDFTKTPNGYALRQLKANVQAGLCGYCERMLVDESGFLPKGVAHIDHFYQKSRPGYEHLTYDWDNLVLSCECGDSCGKHKDRQSIESKDIINPNVEDAHSMMTFIEVPRRKGESYRIEAKEIEGPNRQRAKNTIEALQLNCDRLSALRYNRWLAFKDSVNFLVEYAAGMTKNDEVDLTLLQQEMQKVLHDMERGEFPSAMVARAMEMLTPLTA